MQEEGRALLADERVPDNDMYFVASADMRYVGQEYFVNVPITTPIDLGAIEATFHEAHETRYGHSTPGAPVEFVNLRLGALGRIEGVVHSISPSVERQDPVRDRRSVVFDGEAHETPVLVRDRMAVGVEVRGPMVVEEHSSTTVVPPRYVATIDTFGNLVITRED